MYFKFELGRKVEDKISGFTGIIMGRAEYWTGCNHYAVASEKLTSEGKPMNWEWFDETRIILVGNIQLKLEPRLGEGHSGPMSAPPSM